MSQKYVHLCATSIAAAVLLISSPKLHASVLYPTVTISTPQTGRVTTVNAGGTLVQTFATATNTGSQTLTNVYEFSADLALGGDLATLVSPGTYAVSGTSFTGTATNAAVFITPSETDATLDANSSGSLTTAEIPGFLIAASLAPGASVTFEEDFEVSPDVHQLNYDFFDTANVVVPTPEPASIFMLGSGLLGITGIVKRRFV
jgi:hypothetical protein